jgi:membrane associated rhomboid family serine protease
VSLTGKYAYGTPRTNSPRLSRWATLAFTSPLVFAAVLYLSSVIMMRPWRAELLLSFVPILIITVPFSFLYCLIPSTLMWALLERRPIRIRLAPNRAVLSGIGALYGLICSPVSIAVFSRSAEPKEPSILFIGLVAGAIAGLLSAWLVYPKLEKPALV